MPTQGPIQRIVLATDGSAQAEAALGYLDALDAKPGTTIWVTSVVDVPAPSEETAAHLMGKGLSDWRRVLEIAHDVARKDATGVIARAANQLRDHHPGVIVEEVVRIGEPAAELRAQIDEVGADLFIAGARGHTVLHGLLMGSVSEALVTSAPCPVLIVREVPASFDTVLIAMRTVEDAERLAELCLRLPLPPTSRLIAVAVSMPVQVLRAAQHPFTDNRMEHLVREWAEADRVECVAVVQRFVELIVAGAPGRPVEGQVVRGPINPTLFDGRGDITPAILREGQEHLAALTVVGARESGGLNARLGLGSVSRRLVRRAPGAVLVVREPVAAEGAAQV